MAHYNPHEHLFYFTRPSSRVNPGGMDGHHEVLRSVTNPETRRWNTDTEMVALCLCPKMAERVAKVLADKPKPLRCETNTAEMAADIEAAFIDWANNGNWTPPEEDGGMVGPQDIQTDFEHGQWFVTHKPTGAQWSANDANEDEWDFEQISVGDSE